jgi:hypothetical protein
MERVLIKWKCEASFVIEGAFSVSEGLAISFTMEYTYSIRRPAIGTDLLVELE